MMRPNSVARLVLVLLSWTMLPFQVLATPFEWSLNHQNQHYSLGETVVFTIEANTDATLIHRIFYDSRTDNVSLDTISILANTPLSIEWETTNPGIYMHELRMGDVIETVAIAVASLDIMPLEEEPADFDTFWMEAKTDLAEIDLDIQIELTEENTYSKSYEISLANIAGRRVYGYLSIPNGAGPFPAALVLPPYGDNPNIASPPVFLAERGGLIALSISIHNAPHGQEDSDAYHPNNIADAAENYYYHVIMGMVRSIDYLTSRSDFNGNLAVMGVSQGGGLAIMAAGIDERVDLLMFSNPSHCQHAGHAHEQASGFPYYLQSSANGSGTDAHYSATLEATKYYDAAFFARRYEGPVYGLFSWKDDVTPAITAYAALHQLSGEKVLFNHLELGHEHPGEYWNGRYDFLRQHFPATLNAPFPWTPTTTHYHIDAGENQVLAQHETTLKGTLSLDGELINLPVFWEMIAGPAPAIFTDSTALETGVQLPVPGSYRFRLVAFDEEQLEEAAFYILVDEIIVESGNFLGMNCPENQVISVSPTIISSIATWEMPTAISPCEDSSIVLSQIEGLPAGSTFPLGQTLNVYQALDSCGDTATCEFAILIEQEELYLEANCPENVSIMLPPNELSIGLDWTLPDVNSNCPLGLTPPIQTSGPIMDVPLTEGIYTVSYSLADSCEQHTSCHFNIQIMPHHTEPEAYCEAAGNFPWWDWIALVGLNDLNHASGKQAYSDFTNEIAYLQLNESYSIELGAGFSYFTHPEYWKVWIDFNQDGSFQEASEVVLEEIVLPPPNGTNFFSTIHSITIPLTALEGNSRMRVAKSREGFPNSCGVFEFGEVEDYTVHLSNETAIETRKNEFQYTIPKLQVLPNPATSFVEVSGLSNITNTSKQLQIWNSQGILIWEQRIDKHTPQPFFITINDWAKGVYFLQIKGQAERVRWLKL